MPTQTTDRNLLFGVLALQADFLDAAQFAEACSAWAGSKGTSLADLLVQRGFLTAADRADVARLLDRKLKKHHGDVRACLGQITTDDVRRSLSHIALDSRLAPAHGNLGAALMRQGKFVEAQKSLRRSLELLPARHPLRDLVTKWVRQCQEAVDAGAAGGK